MIGWIKKLNRSPAEHSGRSTDRYDALHPSEKRVFAFSLRQNVYGRITIHRILNQRSIQPLWFRVRKPAVPFPAPLHRSPHSVAVAETNVVAHSDFIAVIDDRSARQRH